MCAERSTEGSTSVSTASRKNSRQIQARIFLLDDSVHTFSINSCAIGHELFMAIIDKQNILEADYFDLEYVNSEGVRCWINHNKCIVKQVGAGKDMVFIFAVKFYTSHPNLLEEEYTRYLFALQIKRDIVSGQLICSTNTAALLASYIVQAEIGDFLDDEYVDNSYLRHLKLVNQSNDEILNKIMEFHKTHIGMSSTEADFHLLDTARKIEYYGVKMHLAKDHENLPLNLSVTHMGVVVFQNLTKINTFSWAKIRKLSFKRKKFLIKLHPEGYGYYKGMVEFYFETRDDCKRFWKKCIEHHAFFRCPASEKSLKKTPKVVTKGSSFRYCGRTQKELIEYVRESYSSKRDSFIRPSKARVSKSPHSNKHSRHGKSYHPFAIKSSYSAPSRAVSDGSDLDRTDMTGNMVPHTPCKQKSMNNNSTKTRWSQSAGQSPRDDLKDVREIRENREIRDKETKSNNKEVGREIHSTTRSGSGSQKRARKGRKFIQVSRTGSSDEDDDDKRVTASEMSLSSSGHWDNSVNGPVDQLNEDPLPAREAFRGGDRLCRQRASIGGFGDMSDSDQPVPVQNQDRARLRPLRQGSEPLSQNSQSPPSRKNQQDPPQRVVCIDQYCTKRPRNPDSLSRNLQPLISSKRYKSTPNDVAGNPKLQLVDQLDSSELLSDIPYVLLRRHKSNEQSAGPASVKSASQSQRSLASKSLKSVKDTVDNDRTKEAAFGRIRHSKSLDRRLAAMDTNTRSNMAPKSPKLLREEYMQSQRRHVSDRDTIEALKNQLRSASSVRSVSRMPNGDVYFRNQATGPMFVSAYRLPPVNNFSAKDDTMSPQTLDLDRLYGRSLRARKKVLNDTNENDGDDEVDTDDIKARRKQKSTCKDSTAFSDSDDSQLRETADLECLLADLLPGNPVYLDSSCSSDDGEFDLSPDRCGRPRSVSESEFKLRTPKSSRRSSICRGHNSSLSLTDSSFNSGTSFQSEEEGDISGSPYSFLAECGQHYEKETKNVQGSSGDSSQLPDDNVPEFHSRSETVDLQILEAPKLLDDSPNESDISPEREHCALTTDSMSIDRDESELSNEESNINCATSSGSASSDRVVIVTGINEPDKTVTEQNHCVPQPNILITSPTTTQNSVTQLLESMLQKRLAGSPFVRTSTPTREYEVPESSLRGSTDNIYQHKSDLVFLKSATSVPGLVTGRVSPYSPLPTYLRRPFASSSSSSSSHSSSISAKNTNPFVISSATNNPFLDESQEKKPLENLNRTGPNNNYEHLFEQSMISNPKETNKKSENHDLSNVLEPFNLGSKEELDRALVFLNEGAMSSLSVGMTPTNHEMAGTFQDTVEGNLMCYESSEYNSRPQSLPDEEEPDEYVLPSDHRSFSGGTSTSSSSSQESSESGHYQAAPIAELILKESIQEHSESSTSASEGSEDIEPFPPPPPPSDLLIFDERDEDIFQQLEERTFNSNGNPNQESNILPKLDCMNSPTEFPQPPPPLLTSGYSKEELSSSEVPSLFADDSAATSVAQTEDDQLGVISSPTKDVPVDEIVIPQHTSLIYDSEDENNEECTIKTQHEVLTDIITLEEDPSVPTNLEMDDNTSTKDVPVEDLVIPQYTSLLYDLDVDNNLPPPIKPTKEVPVDEVIIPQHASLLYEFEMDNNVSTPERSHSDIQVGEIVIPQHTSLLYEECDLDNNPLSHVKSSYSQDLNDVEKGLPSQNSRPIDSMPDYDYGRVSYEDAFPQMDSSLSSLHPSQLNCRSPEEIIDEAE